jgi:hypothetical protein
VPGTGAVGVLVLVPGRIFGFSSLLLWVVQQCMYKYQYLVPGTWCTWHRVYGTLIYSTEYSVLMVERQAVPGTVL